MVLSMLGSFGKIGPQIDPIWAWLSRGHRWTPGARNPLKSLVTGPSLLVNCYLEIKFYKINRVTPPPPLTNLLLIEKLTYHLSINSSLSHKPIIKQLTPHKLINLLSNKPIIKQLTPHKLINLLSNKPIIKQLTPHKLINLLSNKPIIKQLTPHQLINLLSNKPIIKLITLHNSGTKLKPGSDEKHFCQPTSVVVNSDDFIFVSDG